MRANTRRLSAQQMRLVARGGLAIEAANLAATTSELDALPFRYAHYWVAWEVARRSQHYGLSEESRKTTFAVPNSSGDAPPGAERGFERLREAFDIRPATPFRSPHELHSDPRPPGPVRIPIVVETDPETGAIVRVVHVGEDLNLPPGHVSVRTRIPKHLAPFVTVTLDLRASDLAIQAAVRALRDQFNVTVRPRGKPGARFWWRYGPERTIELWDVVQRRESVSGWAKIEAKRQGPRCDPEEERIKAQGVLKKLRLVDAGDLSPVFGL